MTMLMSIVWFCLGLHFQLYSLHILFPFPKGILRTITRNCFFYCGNWNKLKNKTKTTQKKHRKIYEMGENENKQKHCHKKSASFCYHFRSYSQLFSQIKFNLRRQTMASFERIKESSNKTANNIIKRRIRKKHNWNSIQIDCLSDE